MFEILENAMNTIMKSVTKSGTWVKRQIISRVWRFDLNKPKIFVGLDLVFPALGYM